MILSVEREKKVKNLKGSDLDQDPAFPDGRIWISCIQGRIRFFTGSDPDPGFIQVGIEIRKPNPDPIFPQGSGYWGSGSPLPGCGSFWKVGSVSGFSGRANSDPLFLARVWSGSGLPLPGSATLLLLPTQWWTYICSVLDIEESRSNQGRFRTITSKSRSVCITRLYLLFGSLQGVWNFITMT